jgi:hypothetical protein
LGQVYVPIYKTGHAVKQLLPLTGFIIGWGERNNSCNIRQSKKERCLMKTSQVKLKAEFMAEAESLFDQLMTWDDQTHEPNLTQIEEIVLKLRQRLGEQMAQALLARQEKRQPAEKMSCPQCQAYYSEKVKDLWYINNEYLRHLE